MATIFHLTTAAQWQEAQAAGSYTGSTRDATLAEVGFVHCSRGDQWPRVRDALYADVDELLVLLKIDTDLLDVPVVEEPGEPGGEETFPHVYGPLPVTAVTQVMALDRPRDSAASPNGQPGARAATATPATTPRRNPERDFGPLFLKEMFHNLVVLVVACLCVMGLTVLGHQIRDDGYGALAGLAAGFVVGVPTAIATSRRLRRGERLSPEE